MPLEIQLFGWYEQRVNRYLVTQAGKALESRAWALARNFGPLFAVVVGGTALLALAGAVDAPDGVFGVLALGMLAGLFGSVIFLWVNLFRVARRLESAVDAWMRGDIAASVAACQGALPSAFRGDLRAKAFHALGLCAEAGGDFDEAVDLFRRAELAIPSLTAPRPKGTAQALMGAHQALCLCALGRVDEARAALVRGFAGAATAAQRSTWGALLDDTQWGIGAASLNYVLSTIERGRDPSAVLYLAEARVTMAVGHAPGVLIILDRGRPCLGTGLLPRELALAARMEELARQATSGGYRAPAAAVPVDPWAERALGAGGARA